MIGRDGELAALLAAAASTRAGTGRLVDVTGAPGSGKSTLVEALATRLRSDGVVVWSHSATLPEQALSWAGLAALLDHVAPTVLAALPPGLRAHIESITAPDPTVPIRAHGVAVALRETLAVAASAAPLAIILDDENWLDAATAGVVTFAARSVPGHPILLVLARRSAEPSSLDVSGVPDEQREAIVLSGLSAEVIAELVRPIAGPGVRRSVMLALYEQSGGNPMLAAEIARQLASGESPDHVRAPRSVVESLRPRIARLPPATRSALQFAALVAAASSDVIGSATGTDAIVAIGPAEADGLVEVVTREGASPTIRFTHPTIAAAAVEAMPTAELRAAHARLAAIVSDPESRGVHLAASAPPAGDGTATVLETAADIADRRGAPESAALLYRASVDATPPGRDADRRRRLIALAHAQGIAVRHQELLSTLSEVDAPAGSPEADRVATMRVSALVSVAGPEAALAAALASVDSVVSRESRTVALAQIALLERLGNLDRGLRAAERSLDDAERGGDPAAIQTARLSVSVSRVLVGEPVDIGAAVDAAAAWDDSMLLGYAMEELAQLLWFAGDPRARDHVERMLVAATARGDAVTESNALGYLGEIHICRGEWAAAERALTTSPRGETDAPERATLAFVNASLGRVDMARRLVAELDGVEVPGAINQFGVRARRAMTAFALGDADAVEQLELAHLLAVQIGLRAPRFIPFRRDHVESLVAAGRLDEARGAAGEMDEIAERCQLDSARADADAALAVVAAAAGDDESAARLFADAAKVHDRDGDRYELARTLLAAGRAARRAQRRTDARRLLDEAAALFSEMGARLWIERCRSESARIGGRPKRPVTLTPTERQVAERAASGNTNAEIAAAMFVSLRTVESNLSRCYRKLQVRGRVDLAAALARLDG